MHLNARMYDRLLSGRLPPNEARALRAHLAGECGLCEEFLASQADVDALDGLADAAIARELPSSEGAGNDLEFARILRAVRAAPRRRLLPVALAASLAVAGVAALVLTHAPREADAPAWNGVKGGAPRVIPIRLRFLELDAGGAFVKGISGQEIRSSSRLVFEIEASRSAAVALVRVSVDGAPELVWRTRVRPGRVQVGVNGRPAGYPLEGLSGAQRFVLIASDEAVDDERAAGAAAALAPPALSADSPTLDGLSLDVVEVFVR